MGQDRFEVLLENILSKVEIIAEGHDLLNRKIDRVEANLSEKITANSEKIDHLAGTLAETRQELGQKIDRVVADLEAHRNDTERHRGYMVAEHSSPSGQP